MLVELPFQSLQVHHRAIVIKKNGANTKTDMQTNKIKLNALTYLHATSAIQYLTNIPKTYPEGKVASLTNGTGEKNGCLHVKECI